MNIKKHLSITDDTSPDDSDREDSDYSDEEILMNKVILNNRFLALHKVYKKSVQYFFIHIKVSTKYYQKTKQNLKKRLVKGIKIFLRKKKSKSQKKPAKGIKIFFEEEKEK